LRVSDFATQSGAVTEWIERYLGNPEAYPVLAPVRPGDIAAGLPAEAPEDPEDFQSVLADFDRIIIPGITHWNHPRFFAYFGVSATPEGILAETLSATLNVNAMLWRTSPSATELEEVTLRWLGRLLGFPDDFHGVIYDTASIGGFTALAAARESLGLEIRQRGMAGRDLPALRLYITEHTHSHIEKAAIALGLGRDNVVTVGCDDRNQMLPNELEKKIRADIASGMRPMCVVATIGTTSTTSVDPVAPIARIAKDLGVWLHVDAAYAGVTAMLPEFRRHFAGIEDADSIVLNPHKWMFVPVDCSVLYVRDLGALQRTFSLVADYLVTPEEGVRNGMNYGLQLGRRFRALKLWFVLRTLGAKQIRSKLRDHIALAQELATWIENEPHWELMAPHPFSVVCFRHKPPGMPEEQLDVHNYAIIEAVNATGKVFLSSTKLDGRVVLRLSIGNIRTKRDDVALAWRLLRDAALQGTSAA